MDTPENSVFFRCFYSFYLNCFFEREFLQRLGSTTRPLVSWRWTLTAMVTWNAVVGGRVSPLIAPRCSQGAGAHHKPLPCRQRTSTRYQVEKGMMGMMRMMGMMGFRDIEGVLRYFMHVTTTINRCIYFIITLKMKIKIPYFPDIIMFFF